MIFGMERLLVAVDIDGVLAKFTELMIAVFNARYGHKYGPIVIENWRRYRIEDEFSPEIAALLYGIFREPGFFAALEPHDDAHAAVAEMLTFADIEVCSMPPFREIDGRMVVDAHSAADKIGWLVRIFPALAADITLTNKKHNMRSDVLIDDSPGNIERWCAKHPNGLGCLVARPWNVDVALPPNAMRGTIGEGVAAIRTRFCPPVGDSV